jgi:hypothetical protein
MGVGGVIGSIVIAIALLVLLLVIVTRLRRRWLAPLTMILFGAGVISLTLLYTYSYLSVSQDTSPHSYLNSVIRAFYYAGKSFLGEDDFQSIEGALSENDGLISLFSSFLSSLSWRPLWLSSRWRDAILLII